MKFIITNKPERYIRRNVKDWFISSEANRKMIEKLTTMLSREIAAEIDREILRDLNIPL